MRLKNFTIVGTLIFLLFVGAGSCAKPPVKRYYTLVNKQTQTGRSPLSQRCARSIVIAPVESISPYKNEKIIFRTDSYEVKHFNYRLWVSSPEDMMQSLLLRKVESARIFSAVETFVNASSRHLTLYTKLNAIEELDQDGKWHGRLSMRFVLKDEQDENIIWEHEFDETQKASDKNVPALIHTLSEVYNSQTDEMIRSLSKFTKKYSACKKAANQPEDLPEDF